MLYDEDVYQAAAVAAAISALSCFSVLGLYYCHKELHDFAFKLVRDLLVFGVLRAIPWMIPAETQELCAIQAISMSWTALATLLWAGFISYALHIAVICKKPASQIPTERWALALVSSLTTFIVCLPLIALAWDEMVYGPAGGWCWIRAESELTFSWFWRLLVYYLPYCIVLVYSGYVSFHCVWINYTIFKDVQEDDTDHKELNSKLMLHPLILVVCFLPISILRLIDLVDSESANKDLQLASAVFAALNGIANSLVYGLTRQVRELMCGRKQPVSPQQPNNHH